MNPSDLAARLPEPAILRKWSLSLAVLDAIMSPEWDSRYFSFDSGWDEDQQLASMRDGSGNEYTIVFSPGLTAIRGFDHESPASPFAVNPAGLPSGFVENLPRPVIEAIVDEPAFQLDYVPLVTIALWRTPIDSGWNASSPDSQGSAADDNSADLFWCLDGNPQTYADFAAEYYEVEVDPALVARVLAHEPLAADLVNALNPEADFADVAVEAATMVYGQP